MIDSILISLADLTVLSGDIGHSVPHFFIRIVVQGNIHENLLVKTINSYYFKSLTGNSSINVDTAEVGKKVMGRLEDIVIAMPHNDCAAYA